MKKYLLLFIVLLMLSACAQKESEIKEENVSVEPMTADEWLKEAKENGYVCFEDGDITSGQEIWDEFIEKADRKEAATVKLAYYYTLDDQNIDPEYYESIKDEYPVIFIKELTYDGASFTIIWDEDGKEYVENYKYMIRDEDIPESDSALFEKCIRYILVNDNTLTWEDIWQGLISSQIDANVEHMEVYSDYIYQL